MECFFLGWNKDLLNLEFLIFFFKIFFENFGILFIGVSRGWVLVGLVYGCFLFDVKIL